MIEMRWLKRNTGRVIYNQYGLETLETTTVLQYRVYIDHATYALPAGVPRPKGHEDMRWSQWQDVPTVDETSARATALNSCSKCNLDFTHSYNMGFVCSNNPCPSGLGSSVS